MVLHQSKERRNSFASSAISERSCVSSSSSPDSSSSDVNVEQSTWLHVIIFRLLAWQQGRSPLNARMVLPQNRQYPFLGHRETVALSDGCGPAERFRFLQQQE